MIITNVVKTKTVVDYDFRFTHGVPLGVTIDAEAGDTIIFTDPYVTVYIAPRPLPGDPDQKTPARDMVIFLQHVLAYETRMREITPLDPEKQAEMDKYLSALAALATYSKHSTASVR